MPEAAALVPITTEPTYQGLTRAFCNASIHGTKDGGILRPQVLERYVFILRSAEETKWPEIELGHVLQSLQERLKKAVDQVEPTTQYQLIYAVSSVLDAMIDTIRTGLSREYLHEGLLKLLESRSGHDERRLAQVANYAHQALLAIPNDEGPYKALWRHTEKLIGATAKIAGSVSTIYPAKLFQAIDDLKDLPDLVKSMINVAKELSEVARSLNRYVREWKALLPAENLVHISSFYPYVDPSKCLLLPQKLC
jgi:hypothetical protein